MIYPRIIHGNHKYIDFARVLSIIAECSNPVASSFEGLPKTSAIPFVLWAFRGFYDSWKLL